MICVSPKLPESFTLIPHFIEWNLRLRDAKGLVEGEEGTICVHLESL